MVQVNSRKRIVIEKYKPDSVILSVSGGLRLLERFSTCPGIISPGPLACFGIVRDFVRL